MYIFIDTEFTNLGGDQLPGLISIGLVAEGGAECYVELNDFDLGACSDFVINSVLPLRTGPALPSDGACDVVWDFLSGLQDENLVLVHDYYVDLELCLQLLGRKHGADEVKRLITGQRSVRTEQTTAAFVEAQSRFAQTPGFVLHHALHDARALRAGWFGWQGAFDAKRQIVQGTTGNDVESE